MIIRKSDFTENALDLGVWTSLVENSKNFNNSFVKLNLDDDEIEIEIIESKICKI